MEQLSLKHISKDSKIALLQELGYQSDGIFVLDQKGNRHCDPYINEPVKVDNMLIFPGSVIIMDDNPISLTSYIEDHPDAFE